MNPVCALGVLTRIGAPIRNGVTGGCRKFHNMYCTLKYINTSKSVEQGAHTRTVSDVKVRVYHEVRDFKYLGSIITSDNNCERDMKARMTAGNRSYYDHEVTGDIKKHQT
jgi:hypothetical protein